MSTLARRAETRTSLTVTPAAVEQAGEVNDAALLKSLPKELAGFVAAALAIVARGGTVTMGSMPAELTTTTAADVLDVSRPTLMKLVKAGVIPSHKVGSHTRVKSSDVLNYRDSMRAEQRRAFEELREFEDEIGRSY